MPSPKRSAALVVLVLAAMTAVACPPDPTPTPTQPTTPPTPVPVTLNEWSVAAPATVESGNMRFDVRNDGEAVHQFAIYEGGDLDGDAIAGGTLLAQTRTVQAGETATLQASLEPGAYWLVCPIPGHTASGMSAQLTVGS